MEVFFSWILKSGLYLLIFGAVYLIFFKRSVGITFNRFYILFATLFSIVLAALPISFSNNLLNAHFESITSFVSSYMVHFSEVVTKNVVTLLPEVEITGEANLLADEQVLSNSKSINWLFVVLSGITFLFVILFLLRVGKIFQIIFSNQREKYKNMCLVKMTKERPIFSFFRWLFVNKEQKLDTQFDVVYFHENAHFKRLHSLDNLFFELIGFIFWWHPIWYFFRREIKNLHEYEADSIAVKTTDKIDYQKFLLEMTWQGNLLFITNPFNVSLLKKRIIMMNRNKKQAKWNGLLKFAIVLPFIVGAIFIQACDNKSNIGTLEVKGPLVLASDEDGFFAVGPIYGKDGTELISENVKIKLDDAFIETIVKAVTSQQVQVQNTNEAFTVVEKMPEFPGGNDKMMEFISSNIKYPEAAQEQGIQGRVFVQFVIEADGSVSEAKILRGIGGGCDEEAVRVVMLMPKWIPGEQKGEAVRVMFNIPINFTLAK